MNVFNNDKPIYLQIKEYIEAAILNGDLSENEPIPSLRQLAKDFSLNPITIANAINILENDDVLYKKRGVGVFVQKNAKKKIVSKQRSEFIRTTLPQIIGKAKLLDVAEESITECIKNIYGGKDDK
ncbi:MAG: GntR family transcriptional regulator [Candidatus Cloacimonadales bacterium]|jgi:DNA-binding transcriptional regulator YhcF (GntR family)|nr:GntR family transcriptional regulator [Candidatus Cloacimonadales bacterium]HQB41861.1 GntR family transcriptional regulator [Candidatus Cloacimonadota bacterium]